jgi:hypothetical protein
MRKVTTIKDEGIVKMQVVTWEGKGKPSEVIQYNVLCGTTKKSADTLKEAEKLFCKYTIY